ncbi:hypothetical protein BDY24DRAFT_392091 [Mrakia frigida]|uniref:uncharacterized protein n=1 Tax=Mrakia frigida TaxID=29902 RepID=UPI003FCC25B5
MIIEKDTKNLDESRSLALPLSTAPHPPPSYNDSTSLSSPASSSFSPRSEPTSTSAPSTFPPQLLTASRSSHINLYSNHSAVSTTHIIDLNRPVPTVALPAVTSEEERGDSQLIGGGSKLGNRPNGFFWSHHSSCKVVLGVQGTEGMESRERVSVVAGSQHGKVFVEVLSLPSSSSATLPALSLHLSCTHSLVTLLLPRSFHGPLTHSTTHGAIKISTELQKVYTPMSSELGFVGHLGGWTGGGSGEDGELDEAKCESKHGGVRIGFEGEAEDAWGEGLYTKVASDLGVGGWGIRWGAKK